MHRGASDRRRSRMHRLGHGTVAGDRVGVGHGAAGTRRSSGWPARPGRTGRCRRSCRARTRPALRRRRAHQRPGGVGGGAGPPTQTEDQRRDRPGEQHREDVGPGHREPQGDEQEGRRPAPRSACRNQRIASASARTPVEIDTDSLEDRQLPRRDLRGAADDQQQAGDDPSDDGAGGCRPQRSARASPRPRSTAPSGPGRSPRPRATGPSRPSRPTGAPIGRHRLVSEKSRNDPCTR